MKYFTRIVVISEEIYGHSGCLMLLFDMQKICHTFTHIMVKGRIKHRYQRLNPEAFQHKEVALGVWRLKYPEVLQNIGSYIQRRALQVLPRLERWQKYLQDKNQAIWNTKSLIEKRNFINSIVLRESIYDSKHQQLCQEYRLTKVWAKKEKDIFRNEIFEENGAVATICNHGVAGSSKFMLNFAGRAWVSDSIKNLVKFANEEWGN